jgi:Glycosyl transferases group 1
MPESTLPVMDAMQAGGHTPVVMSMDKIATMYQDFRYAKHACYDIFKFYFKDLMKENRVDFGFSIGLIGILEDVSKAEAHNLTEEAGIPSIIYLNCRDEKPAQRLLEIGAAGWQHTFIACSTPELVELLVSEGIRHTAYSPPATSLRIFYREGTQKERKPFPVQTEDARLARGFDVCFAGAWSPEREELLKPLLKAGVRFAVFGDQKWEQSAVGEAYRGAATYLTDLNTVYNSAKVVLDLRHPLTQFDGYVSSRVIDSLAAGTMVLTYQRDKFPALLDHEHELATFSGPVDLLKAVQYYLSNDVERHRLASKGMYKVQQTCTWSGRLSSLLPQLEIEVLRAS